MENAFKLLLDTFLLVALLVIFFQAIFAPDRLHRPIWYYGGLFFLNIIVAMIALVWIQSLKKFWIIATVNPGGVLFGLVFGGLGIYLLIVTLKDHTRQIVVPLTIIGTGIALAVLSCIS